MNSPRKVIAKILVEVEAEVLLDRDGNVEEVQEIREVYEATEVLSIRNVLTTQ